MLAFRKRNGALFLLIATLSCTIGRSQEATAPDLLDEFISCASGAYLPVDPIEIHATQLERYWFRATEYDPAFQAPPDTLEPGSEVSVRFDFVIDWLGCTSGYRIVESSGYSSFDAALVNDLRNWRYEPAETNSQRQPVSVEGELLILFRRGPEKPRYGSLDGSIGGATISLTGISAYYKPDRYSDQCTFDLVSTPMDPYSISFWNNVPCTTVEELVGREFRPTDQDREYSLNVASDFGFDETGDDGSYRTRWHSTRTTGRTTIRFLGYEDGYLIGEIGAEVMATMRDTESVRSNREFVSFAARFRAHVVEWSTE